MKKETSEAILTNFDLKTVAVDLFRIRPKSERAFLSIEQLETIRTGSQSLSASKFGLETICGASSEIGNN